MRLLFGHDADVAHWVAERIPHAAVRIPYYDRGQVFGPSAAIGVVNGAGDMVAGVVYHNYDPFVRSIEVSMASTTRMWARPDVVRSLLRYIFVQANCLRCTAVTPRSATSPRRFLEGIGFKREGSIRRGFGSENALVYGLLADEWAAGRFREDAPTCDPEQPG